MTNRNLTDDDVEAIVEGLWTKASNSFKLNVGSGVIGLVWKGILLAVVILASYGAGLRMKMGM